jgi:enamine deaminase RidA (YjgF/YER057c/UK114 family)
MTKEVIRTDRLMTPIAHFSHACRIGDVVHVGATAGTDAERRLAGATPGSIDVSAQTRRVFENLEIALGLLRAGLEDVVRIKTYVADPRDIPMYRDLYGQRFGALRPAHAIVGSWDFPLPQAAIELEAVAVVGTKAERLASAIPADDGSRTGVRVGDHHYGTALPIQDGAIVPGDPATQARQALRNLSAMLAAGGLSPRDVVSLHVTLADMRDFAAFEAAFRETFEPPYPCRTVVGAPLAEPEMLVQLESISVAGGGEPLQDPTWPKSLGCASPAMIAGDTLHIGGQIGADAQGAMAPEAEAQTRAAWTRIHRLIAQAGFHPESVLRTNNVLADWRTYAGFNAGYGGSVRDPYPPRTTVLGQLPDPRALVQVEAVAHRRDHEATIVQAAGFR